MNPFKVKMLSYIVPGFSLRSNPGLKLANAFGVLQPPSSACFRRGLRRTSAAAFGVFKLNLREMRMPDCTSEIVCGSQSFVYS